MLTKCSDFDREFTGKILSFIPREGIPKVEVLLLVGSILLLSSSYSSIVEYSWGLWIVHVEFSLESKIPCVNTQKYIFKGGKYLQARVYLSIFNQENIPNEVHGCFVQAELTMECRILP